MVLPEEGLSYWRDKLCVQGGLLGGKGETGLEPVSWHLLTQEPPLGSHLTSWDSEPLHLWSLSSGANEHHVDLFFFFLCVNMRMCMFRTLSDYTVPPNVHSMGVPGVVLFDTILKQQWDHVWMRDNRVVTPHSKANPLSSDALVRRKCYPQCTFLCSLHYRVSQIG